MHCFVSLNFLCRGNLLGRFRKIKCSGGCGCGECGCQTGLSFSTAGAAALGVNVNNVMNGQGRPVVGSTAGSV